MERSDEDGEGETPAIVGVRLRRVTVVATAPDDGARHTAPQR